MIGSLRGVVLERTPPHHVLIEVSGVGYLVVVTPRVFGELEPTTSCFLNIHHQVREDAQTLFGFLSREERETFQILLGAHGVGPSMAMAILATHSPGGLRNVVLTSDIAGLTMVPGVGKKTAERLLVELRGKFDVLDIPSHDGSAQSSATSVLSDLREALTGLGYDNEEIRGVLSELNPSEGESLEKALRDALNVLGARRA